MSEGQIRLNKVTKEWVIYAPSRRKRPQDFQKTNRIEHCLPIIDPTCPFCQGNEQDLKCIVLELQNTEHSCWQTRVITNKFPALTPNKHMKRFPLGIYLAMSGYGEHEVIVESPKHNEDIATMTQEVVDVVIETYHKRYLELMAVHENMMAIIFRNRGERAGASLKHPHSQIIVTGMVPRHVRWRELEAQMYFDEWGRCLYCDILEFEMKERRRVIQENLSFVAFIPFAADVPFEIWIMPKNHQADFGSVSDQEKSDFALILKQVLANLYEKLNNPDYNYVIHTAARYKAEEPQLHWYCQILPRTTTPAGFEIGSGMSINPSLPEFDADFLNS
ncbi:galactose-1-phosphate uridylyltransferase [Lyngbya aestuarii]|uniref:galactose-1-phosphate uridylyltransferase n=1 Tax=Lyngbya aestuarii TaxID=118322 RepID=UPI00403D6C24